MTKHYVVGNATLQMAHRSAESELAGRIYSQTKQGKSSFRELDVSVAAAIERELKAPSVKALPDKPDCNIPTQIEKFYARYGQWSAK